MKKIAFLTFGCRLNRAEALDLETRYSAGGWDTVPLPPTTVAGAVDESPKDTGEETPEVIVVRCCSVTAKAQRDCEKKITQLKTRFPKAEILITGCHPDAKPIPAHLAPPALPDSEAPISRQLSRAYLKVQDGCSGKCAFCIVPSFRGTPVSIPFDKAIARAKAYLDAGFREIVITGCNLCLYHNNGKRLAELISALAEIESPGHRIRLGSIEPGICDTALLDAIEAHPNICRFLHLSLQSGSDRILRLMRRPYTIGHVAEFCADARRRFGARLAIGADVITGFPGETEADFKATKSFLYSPMRTEARLHDIPLRRDGAIAPYPSRSTAQLSTHSSAMGSSRPTDPLSTLNFQLSTINYLHVFPYSEREGTEAASMAPSVPVETRRRRAKELEEIGASNREAFARSFIGKAVEVCIERDGNGYSEEYVHCILEGTAPRRSLVMAKVTDYFPQTASLSATIRT